MGAIEDGILVSMVLLVTLEIGNCDGIRTDQCSITGSCLQCLSSETSELERCIQLNLLVTRTTNRSRELDTYCTGQCPIILATAYYYCELPIPSLFNVCRTFEVQPTGAGGFRFPTAPNSSCSSFSMSDGRGCELCTHRQSNSSVRCLQHQLLAQNTNNPAYRRSFCASGCPLTQATSIWYCGGNVELPFQECRQNRNGSYCEEILEDVYQDENVRNCSPSSSTACERTPCRDAIRKYGCCVRAINSSYGTECGVMDCPTLETGGSRTNLATPLLAITMMMISLAALLH